MELTDPCKVARTNLVNPKGIFIAMPWGCNKQMALMMLLWYTSLILTTLEMSGNLIISSLMDSYTCIQNFSSLIGLNDPEEALVVHQLDPEVVDLSLIFERPLLQVN